MMMDYKKVWVKDGKCGAWSVKGAASLTFLVQGNPAGLESLARALQALAKEHNGSKASLSLNDGLSAGDCTLTLQRSDFLLPPPNPELSETRVEAPEVGDTVLWMNTPDTSQDGAANVLMQVAGYTSIQSREIVQHRSFGVRVGLALANKLRDALGKVGVKAELFHSN